MTSLEWWCESCGSPKPDAEPGRACPAECGSRVTSSRPPATVTAALAILEHAGWKIRTHTGVGRLVGDLLVHAGPMMAHVVNADPQAYGYPAGTVVVDEPRHAYTHLSASEPWQLVPATVPDQEDTPVPDDGGTPEL